MSSTSKISVEDIIVFYDGVCNLCNFSVNFIIDRDKKKKIKFAALQSHFAKKKLEEKITLSATPNSIILLEKNKVYQKSTSVLRIARHLQFPWPSVYIFIIIPAFIRDLIYSFIAKNRYRFFGKTDKCRMPTQDVISRFLDYE